MLRSVDFAEIEELQRAGDWVALGRRYAARGARPWPARAAEVVGILANTMHLVHDAVVRGAGADALVPHVVDAVADAATAAGADRLALLGTRYTMESSLYPDRLRAHAGTSGASVTSRAPSGDDADEVHRIIYDELVRASCATSPAPRCRPSSAAWSTTAPRPSSSGAPSSP